ncbi:Druantia anti-phage system protein DruA [Kyrpidia tusciae]|uniref:Uncharacterized protein n=1 Tax=Kyrpidia tusciae (strain DSM 2912 / NBRC 15312 / T2) TaxID=562970 RepID=D5WWC7_KYRT2|nr:Druantia anti-phage system protein DruA [Kyrpidia tusciae]ADG07692.1 hypothetical protein Btus_3074 [Kyrpidia tusciae DSM 2912]
MKSQFEVPFWIGDRKVRAERSMVVHAQLHASLQDVRPIAVEPVTQRQEVDWNATITAYHPLGFTLAIRALQRYWIRGNGRHIMGAFVFGAAAKALAARDEWIGWSHSECGIGRGLLTTTVF